jgi:hypothetical protein
MVEWDGIWNEVAVDRLNIGLLDKLKGEHKLHVLENKDHSKMFTDVTK